MTGTVIFDPLLPWLVVGIIAGVAALSVGIALWRGLRGWPFRALAALALLAALSNPSYQEEERAPLSDIVLMVVDDSASQSIADRPSQTADAVARLTAQIEALPNTELRVIPVGDAEGDGGTLLATALAQALAEEPSARIAGAILVTDGQLHDVERMPNIPAPLHTLLTGLQSDWDRRLMVRNAPAFAILDEPLTLTLRIEDQGAVPEGLRDRPADLTISIDGGEPQVFSVPVNQDIDLPITLPHGGMNVIQFHVAEAAGELTARNNAAVVQINGVRDRLRVLLVSGEPHAGERTWRNLLKSDSSVDLVHFTILRPPEKQDGIPVSELSLIAFPTRELFVDKIEEFDLIIFDRYRRRGILPNTYMENIRDYVLNGGAVLVSGGPDYASADSLYRSPLADILPGAPSGRVIEEGYLPQVTDLGHRHPVTAGLEGAGDADTDPTWGRWLRLVDVQPTPDSEVVMSGADGRPLLILDRLGEGRVALMASDHAWLWNRGFEGGGPQLELLRRLAHWMMKEPELEEEALTAIATGQSIAITRRTLTDGTRDVTITAPDGTVTVVPLEETAPGRLTATFNGPEIGLYRLSDGELDAVVALGPAAPREFEETIASGARLEPAVEATRGGVLRLEDGVPSIRRVAEGRGAAGRGWIGLTPRDAYLTADVRVAALLPAWAFLLLAAAFTLAAWLREGRR